MPVAVSILWKPLRDPHYVVASLQPGGGGLRQLFMQQSTLREIQTLVRGNPEQPVVGLLVGQRFDCSLTLTPYVLIASHVEVVGASLDEHAMSDAIRMLRGHVARRDSTEVVGWYCAGPSAEAVVGRAHAAAHSASFEDRWQTALIFGHGGDTGAFFLHDSRAARWFHAPFYEVTDSKASSRAPKPTCIAWPAYLTTASVVPLFETPQPAPLPARPLSTPLPRPVSAPLSGPVSVPASRPVSAAVTSSPPQRSATFARPVVRTRRTPTREAIVEGLGRAAVAARRSALDVAKALGRRIVAMLRRAVNGIIGIRAELAASVAKRRAEADAKRVRESERQAREAARRRVALEEAQRRAIEEEKRRAAEAEARRASEAEARRKAAEETERRRVAEAEARRKAAEEAEQRRIAEAEAAEQRRVAEAEAAEQRRIAEAEEAERRRAAEAEARRKAAEEAEQRRVAEAEARRQAAEAEAARLAKEAEAEAQRRAEEAEAKRAAEVEAQRKAAEEAQRRAAEEEARRRAIEEARRRAAEEAQRKAAEEEQRRAAEAEARRQAVEAEARRLAAEAEARRLAEAEAEARRLAEAEAKAQREAAEAEARRLAEAEAQRLAAEEEAKRRAEEAELEAQRLAEKERADERRRAAEAEAEARRKAAEADALRISVEVAAIRQKLWRAPVERLNGDVPKRQTAPAVDFEDTTASDGPYRYLALAGREGFEVSERIERGSDEHPETVWLLHEPESGLRLIVVTTDEEVREASLHYNLRTEDDSLLRITPPEHRDLDSRTIYAREACLHDLRARCRRLRATGALERDWKVSPSFQQPVSAQYR